MSSFLSETETEMAPTPPLPLSHSRITLQQRPRGDINTNLTSAEGTFKLETNVRVTKKEELKDGEVVVGTEWISLDPAMRGLCFPSSHDSVVNCLLTSLCFVLQDG